MFADNVDSLANILACLILSGSCTGALAAARKAKLRKAVQGKKRQALKQAHRPDPDSPWAQTVEDLATRSISVGALLNFCKELGVSIMRGYDPATHTTHDVVR